MSRKFNKHGTSLTFEFDSHEAANHFKIWMSEGGEQDYWEYMKYRESDEDGDITGIDFEYHSGTDKIPVKCGRFTTYLEDVCDV